MLVIKVNSESERIALISALGQREETIRAEIIDSVLQMESDLDNGGKDYWGEKLIDLAMSLKATQRLLLQAREAKPVELIKEDDL